MKKAILFTTVLSLALLLGACGAKSDEEETAETMEYDFKQFSNVSITGIDLSSLNEEELAVLYAQARYCQAMTDADIDTMREHQNCPGHEIN